MPSVQCATQAQYLRHLRKKIAVFFFLNALSAQTKLKKHRFLVFGQILVKDKERSNTIQISIFIMIFLTYWEWFGNLILIKQGKF
jgi:hypothetical protein